MTEEPKDEVPTTPTDSPTSPSATPRRMPNRGIRKRVLGEGEGDYCIYEIVGQDQALPMGVLLPISGVPRFTQTQEALKWIRQQSGDLLAGKQVMIFKACEVLNLEIQSKPTLVIGSKPKVVKTAPEGSNWGGKTNG